MKQNRNTSHCIDCNEIVCAIQNPALVKPWKLSGGHPVMKGIRPVMYAGGYCLVFPYMVGGHKYAVRCWYSSLDGMEERARKISSALKASGLPYFAPYEFVRDGIVTSQGVAPIVIMDWIDAQPLKEWIAYHLGDTNAILELAKRFVKMVSDLHDNDISHGDLQHGNILVRPDGNLMLVDYDSMYVPQLKGHAAEIAGLRGYQHPDRDRMKTLSPKMDYFSELVIYTSLRAIASQPSLWNELKIGDSETLVFSGEDLDSRGKAPIFGRLSGIPGLKGLVDEMKAGLKQHSIGGLRPLEDVIDGKGSTCVAPAQQSSWLDKMRESWRRIPRPVGLGYNSSDVALVRRGWNR